MVFDIKSVSVALLLAVVYGVSSFPQPSGIKAGDNQGVQGSDDSTEDSEDSSSSSSSSSSSGSSSDTVQLHGEGDQITHIRQGNSVIGSIVVSDEKIQGHIVLPKDNSKQSSSKGNYLDNTKTYNDNIAGKIEINDDAVKGQVKFPSDSKNKKLTKSEHEKQIPSGSGRNKNVIKGNMEIDTEHIQGHIDIPSDVDIQTHVGVGYGENNQNDNKAIAGIVNINDDHIEGHVKLPTHDDQQNAGVKKGYNNQDGNKAIAGTVEINDDRIEGHVELPTDDDQQQAVVENLDNNQNDNEGIAGTVEINDDHIEGHVELPSDDDQQQAGVGNGDNNQNDNKAIAGNVEINDEQIEGHIELPTDNDHQHAAVENGANNENDDIAIAGEVQINDEHIEGYVKLPTDDDQLHDGVENGNNNQNENKAIAGSVEINDEHIEGHIEVPSDYDQQHAEGDQDNNTIQENGDIAGSVKINDDYIKGNVVIPGDTEGQSDGDKNEPEDVNDGLPEGDHNGSVNDKSQSKKWPSIKEPCWMTLKANHHFDALDKLDEKYRRTRVEYQNKIGKEFDKKMLNVLLASQAAAPRAIHQAQGDPNLIPAGINLGGHCMMRVDGSILFFHRMKLRNSTRFTVKYLHNDLVDMTLTTRIFLNDIHLQGAYERATTDRAPSSLFFFPNIGEVAMLLKNVVYKMEGRLRMLNNRLVIELINSDLLTPDILMTYLNANSTSEAIPLQPRNIEDFLQKLKCDLDLWLKDYFNDYFMYFGIAGGGNRKFQTYEKKKTIRVNEYADEVINSIKERLKSLGASNAKLPNFNIYSIPNTNIKLSSGVARGLNSIYRRSVGTTKKDKNIRKIDIIVGFSNLKAEYKYEASVSMGMPPLTGKLILVADELTARMEVSHIIEPETIDINIDSIIQTKPESLTIEGPANRWIGNFKQLLEHPIISIMINTLIHNIKMLKTLSRCEPYLVGNEKKIHVHQDTVDDENSHVENNIDQDPADDDLRDAENYENPSFQTEDPGKTVVDETLKIRTG